MQVDQELERYTGDMVYFDEHRQELLEQYPERWVAVYDKRVVGAAKSLKRLISKLKKEGIPPGQVYREYVTKDDILLIVAALPT